MDKTVCDFRAFENNLLQNIFKRYIQPNHPDLTFQQFKRTIISPLRDKPKTQEDIIKEEIQSQETDERETCYFIILAGNKMRRCKLKPLDDDFYCYLHTDKDDELATEYMALKHKYTSAKK